MHAFVNDLERPIGTYLYGRRMYEMMVVLGDAETVAGQRRSRPGLRRDLAGGRQGRVLDDAADGCPAPGPGSSGPSTPSGPEHEGAAPSATLASAVPTSPARRSGPGWWTRSTCSSRPIVVGGGTRALPDGVRLKLELLDERRFVSGVVHLHYRTVT